MVTSISCVRRACSVNVSGRELFAVDREVGMPASLPYDQITYQVVRRGKIVSGRAKRRGLTVVLRTPSPVGHWNSAEGYDRFVEIYDRVKKELPEPAVTRDIRTEYGEVRVYRFDGPSKRAEPLVLLPGRSSASPVWAGNMPSLLEVADVYTIDLLGEPGMSVQTKPITSADDQARWLHQVLDALPEERFNIVGLSIGGWSGTNLAVRQPEHVASLTTVDPVYVYDNMPIGTMIRAIPAGIKWLPKSWRDSFNSYTAGGAPVEDVPVADMIEAGMSGYTLRLPQPTRITEEQLSSLRMPVLAIIAGRSVMHDPKTATETAQRALGNKTVKVYPDASHAINGEYPNELATDLEKFLTEHS
jgi:pimeloyl-ACP methyl ester carboxylesterase